MIDRKRGGCLGLRAWGRRSVTYWLLAAVLSAGSASGQQADRPPVLLRKSFLLTPIETAGTGLAPEVKVRAEIDARGRVVEVAALNVTPASEYDELVRQATRKAISNWRYAPAIKAGKATATTLEWTVKFQAREASNSLRSGPSGWLSLGSERAGAESRRARVLALPLKQRKALLRHQTDIAEKFLDRAHRHRSDSPRFVVVADTPEESVARITAGNLEAIFNVIQGLFGDRIESQPEPFKIVVYMYAQRASFEQLKRKLGVYEWSAGFYSPAGLFAFHLEVPTMDDLLGIMMHEATHAYVDRHLVTPGFYLPRWLGEGFAEYVGNSEIKKGRLIPGRTAKSKFVLIPGYGAVRAKPTPRMSLEEVKRTIRKGEGLSVEQLTTADHTIFYGEKHSLYYPSSWLLVHFLRHGEPGWAEREFPALMLYAAEGYPVIEAMKTVYGTAPADLEERFRTYVQKEF